MTTKQSGLGMNFYVGGVDVSGDISAFSKIGGPQGTLDVTGIDKFANERLGAVRDGEIDFTSFFNPLRAHPVFSALPTSDVQVSARIGLTVGAPSVEMVAKQVNYDPTRATGGALTAAVACSGEGYGLEWGLQLTAGIRTDAAATNGASIDTAAPLAFGAQAYLQVFAITGTDATVKLQDSADNVTFVDIAGMAFTQTTTAPGAQRIATVNTATIRRYIRASTVTTGGFTSLQFAVTVVKNPIAGIAF